MTSKQELIKVNVGDSLIIFEDIEADGKTIETARIDYEVVEVLEEVDTEMREQLYIGIRPLEGKQLLPTAEVYFYLDTAELFFKNLMLSNGRVRKEMVLIDLKNVEVIPRKS